MSSRGGGSQANRLNGSGQRGGFEMTDPPPTRGTFALGYDTESTSWSICQHPHHEEEWPLEMHDSHSRVYFVQPQEKVNPKTKHVFINNAHISHSAHTHVAEGLEHSRHRECQREGNPKHVAPPVDIFKETRKSS